MTSIPQVPIRCHRSLIPRVWVVLKSEDSGHKKAMASAVKDCAHGNYLVTLHFRSTFSEGRSCVEPHTDIPNSVMLIRHMTYAIQCADGRTTKRQ